MKKSIVVVAPSESFANNFKKILFQKKLDFAVYITTGKDTIELGKELLDQNIKIVISRGHNVSLLRKILRVPVIDVKYTYEDMYYSYQEALNYGRNIAFIGFKDAIHIAELFKKISNQPIMLIEVNKIQKVQENLLQFMSNNQNKIDVLIGGKTTQSAAQQYNINYISTKVGDESVISAINDALHIYHIEKEKVINQSIMNAILESSNNGIIAVDDNYRILFKNEFATQILMGKTEQFIEQYLTCLNEIDKVNQTNGIRNQVVIFNEISLIFDYEPIRNANNKTYGYVATIQNVKNIQSTEKEIRKNLISKSHYARKTFDDIIGKSDETQKTIADAKKYALTDSTILITGESGTGKEVYAQSIHNFSQRKNEPFVAVNCGAIAENLLESELFGYVKGAFTGANNEGKEGLFELAHKGTIFLDEIGEVSKSFQVKLLRVLQEKEIIRVGSSKVIPIDVRVIVATNKNLIKRIKKKKFREDLFYRLNVLRLIIPPLRERKADIPDLISFFISQYNKRVTFSDEALELLVNYEYPGNVRQLNNMVERLIVLNEEKKISSKLTRKTIASEPIIYDMKQDETSNTTLISYEKDLILNALKQNNGKKSATAKQLGISTATLWRKLKEYEIAEPL